MRELRNGNSNPNFPNDLKLGIYFLYFHVFTLPEKDFPEWNTMNFWLGLPFLDMDLLDCANVDNPGLRVTS